MRFFPKRSLHLIAIAGFSLNLAAQEVRELTDSEAYEIVREQEQAKERSKDEREAELLSADILETAVADLGHKKVIFNRVRVENESATNAGSEPNGDSGNSEEDGRLLPVERRYVYMSLSGSIYDDEVCELWWNSREHGYFRIFTNVDFRLFNGTGDFTDGETHYSLLNLIVAYETAGLQPSDEWRPGPDDFTPDNLEYFIMDWGNREQPNPEDFEPIEAAIRYFAENKEAMRTRYENNRKLAEARKDYLKNNPPKKRNVIVNYRPYGQQ